MSLRVRDRLSFFFAVMVLFFSFGLAASWAVTITRPIPEIPAGTVPVTEYPDAGHSHAIEPKSSNLLLPVSLPAAAPLTRPVERFAGTPRIAVIIDDMGLNRVNSGRVIDLDSRLTLSYLPYAADVQAQVDAARAQGHEIMLHLPMEALDRGLSAGPKALTTRLDETTFQNNLIENLTAFSGYVGVNNHMGSRLTASSSAMQQVMQALDIEDVYFVDSWTSGRSVAYHAAAAAGLPRARRDVFLDHEIGQVAVWRALRQAEGIAARTGQAVVIGHPRSDTIAVLRAWLPDVTARGVQIVPMSELLYDGDLAGDPVLQADARRQASR